MSRLIDVDAAIGRYYAEYKKQDIYDGSQDRDWLKRCIDEAPTIEAEPVRHGRWVIEKRHTVSRNPYIDDNYFASATCSECDFCIHAETKSFGYPDLNTTNYCPNCGAKMDKEE